MRIMVNGAARDIEGGSVTVFELLGAEGVESPEMVAVQVNGDFVAGVSYASTTLKEGDAVEFLYFMGGGRR